MRNRSPFRQVAVVSLGVLTGLLAVGSAGAQGSGLPVNAPTRAGSDSAVLGGALRGAKRADVEYTGGMLHVTANNSSLNQILREVGRLTGMKITGGVQEDRVFGSYGPAPASDVLAKLLDGTPSNFMIVENDQAGPAELVLTQRKGGPSPPNPNAAMAEEQEPQPQVNQQNSQGFFLNGQGQPQPQPQAGGGPPGVGGLPPSNGGQTGTPVGGGANLGTTPGAFPGFGQTPPDATAQPAAASDGQTSNNGVATPQQIYEQLQKLRQQQQQANPQ